jgi:hypothetical protein
VRRLECFDEVVILSDENSSGILSDPLFPTRVPSPEIFRFNEHGEPQPEPEVGVIIIETA